MSEKATLEKLEQMIAQLTPEEQIKLIASMSQRLSKMKISEATEELLQKEYAARIEAFLKMSEEMAAKPIVGVDSAKDIREIREERTSGL
jgi:transcription elongation GreA/GreB family factor